MTGPRPSSADTPPEVQALLAERWRRMSPAEKARLVDAWSRDLDTLARAGIRTQFPGATPDEVRFHLAVRKYGLELARRVYPQGDRGRR